MHGGPFVCWERIPIDRLDPRLTMTGPFGAPYGNIRFTPLPGTSNTQLLGAIEEVIDLGRTIRNLIHTGKAPSPAVFSLTSEGTTSNN